MEFDGGNIITQRADLVEGGGCLSRCLGGVQSACFIILVLTCVCGGGGGTSVRLFYLQGMMYHSFSLERQ